MKTFNTRYLYLYKFISQCLPIYAFYQILFIERGLSISQVALLIALWSGFSILFEIPFGIIADRWNRRNMLVIAALLQGFCFLIWGLSHSFLLFLAGFILWGLSGSIISGTEESLIYDNLKSEGKEAEFTNIYSRAEFWANVGALTGIISAGLLINIISIGTIAFISVVMCIIDALFVFQIRESNLYQERMKNEEPSFLDTIKEAGEFIKGNKVTFTVVIFIVLFATLGSYLDEFDAFITYDFGLSKVWVSVILTVRFIFIALGDLLAPYVQKKVSSLKGIFVLTSISNLILFVFTLFWSFYALIVFGISMMLMAIASILLVNILQNEIKEEGRATVMSFVSIGQNIAMIIFSVIYATLIGLLSLQVTYIIIAIYGVLGCLCFFVIANRRS